MVFVVTVGFSGKMQIKVIVKNIPIISENKSYLETLGMIPGTFYERIGVWGVCKFDCQSIAAGM
jgi:hypothetical protein